MSDTTTSAPASDAKPLPKKRSWRWRFFRFVVLSFFGLVTLFVLFHAVENWRGKRAWEQYRKAQEAKGVSFDYNTVVPPPVPDDQNFAMTPLLKPLLDLNPPGTHPRQKDSNGVARANSISGLMPLPINVATNWLHPRSWRLGGRLNLEGWQQDIFASTNLPHRAEMSTPAEDVLYALKQHDAALSELLMASQNRPLSRFNVNYEEESKPAILVPHLAPVKNMVEVLRMRAIASLAAGKNEPAFSDVNLMLRLTESIDSEPFLISKLVRIACIEMSVTVIWEGLVGHSWTEEQLKALQTRLSSYDLIKDGWYGFEGERQAGNHTIEFLRKYPHMMGRIGYNSGGVNLPYADGRERHWFKLIPSGWFFFEQVNYNTAYERLIMSAASRTKDQIDLNKLKETSKAMELELSDRNPLKVISNHRVLSYLLLPWVKNFSQKSVYAQSTIDLAIVALALERYHLKHQDYPANLDALVPEYVPVLPLDIAVQAPFKYERQSKDAFRLWSVGWNQRDDGGVVVMGTGNARVIKLEEGDWTWPQVEKVTAIKPTAPAGSFE